MSWKTLTVSASLISLVITVCAVTCISPEPVHERQIFCCIYWGRSSICSSAWVSGLSKISPAYKESQRLSTSLLIALYHHLFLSYFLYHVFTSFTKGRLKMAATTIAGFHPVHTSNSNSTIFPLLIFNSPPHTHTPSPHPVRGRTCDLGCMSVVFTASACAALRHHLIGLAF